MTRQALAIGRLELSRQRLRAALVQPSAAVGMLAMASRLVREHPLAAATLALLLGAAVARARPWRWALKPALWAAAVPLLMAAAEAAPAGLWATLLNTLLRQATAPNAPQDPPSADR